RERRARPKRKSSRFGSCSSLRQRVGAELEMRGQRPCPLAAFDQPRGAVAVRRPQPAALPAGIGVVDAAVESLGVEAERIRHADRHHLAILVEGDEAVHQVGGRHRNVLTEPESVVLVDPRVVARLGAVLADAPEARTGILVKRPALTAVVAGRLGSIEPCTSGGRKRPYGRWRARPRRGPCLSMSPPRGPKPGRGTL